MSLPTLLKPFIGVTVISMNASPAGMFSGPGSPRPLKRSFVPEFMPAGIFTLMLFPFAK